MKRFWALLLATVMVLALAVPALAAEGTTTVYLDIGDTDFGDVYCYAYEESNTNNKNADWPGVQMTHVTGSIYSIELSDSLNTIIFHNNVGNAATDTLQRPTDGRDLYTYDSGNAGEWSFYASYKGANAGDYTVGVNGTYVAGSTATEVISVDITWETLSFTYTAGGSTYDPSTHLTTSGGGSWSTDKPGITVTNHSNAAIEASMSFAAATGVTTTGSFYTKGEGETYTAITSAADQKLSLATAAGTAVDNAPKGTLYFGVSGAPITENKTLGTITVKIGKDQWTRVSTEEELHTALENGAHVKLMNDITAVENVWVDFVDGAVLDLNGKTLNAALGMEGQCEVKNGTINSNSHSIYANYGDTVRITDCTINAGDETEGAINVAGTLILSGRIDLQYEIVLAGGSVTCLAGTYNFDPTAYVDANTYTVTANTDGTWTVAAKTN